MIRVFIIRNRNSNRYQEFVWCGRGYGWRDGDFKSMPRFHQNIANDMLAHKMSYDLAPSEDYFLYQA